MTSYVLPAVPLTATGGCLLKRVTYFISLLLNRGCACGASVQFMSAACQASQIPPNDTKKPNFKTTTETQQMMLLWLLPSTVPPPPPRCYIDDLHTEQEDIVLHHGFNKLASV